MQRLSAYIHELESWSNFTWRLDQLILPLSEVHFLQGRILGEKISPTTLRKYFAGLQSARPNVP